MQLRTIGFQLRLVGHCTNQRMPEGILGGWSESHLIDQLRAEQFVDDGVGVQCGQKLCAETGSDH